MYINQVNPEVVVREVAALWRFEPWRAEGSRDLWWATYFSLPSWSREGGYTVDFALGMPGWGSDLTVVGDDGRRLPLVIIDSAPDDVWRRFDGQEIREHQTWIAARDRQGFRNALALARWLISPTVPTGTHLNCAGVAGYAGQAHRRLPCWKELRAIATVPGFFRSMPKVGPGWSRTAQITWEAPR